MSQKRLSRILRRVNNTKEAVYIGMAFAEIFIASIVTYISADP